MVRRCRAWHDRMGLGQHKWSNYIGHDKPSSYLGSTDDRMMSGVACPHGPWATHMVGRRRVSHDLIALGQHTPSDITGHFMPSSSLGSTHDWTTLGVERIQSHYKAYTIEQRRRGMLTLHLDITQDQTMLGVACLHGPCEAHTVG